MELKAGKPEGFFRLIVRTILLGGKGSVALVVSLAVASAIFEAIGVGSVMPFIAVATNSGAIDRSETLFALEQLSGLGRNEFIVLLGVLFATVTVLANVANAASMAALTRFGAKVGHTLSSRLLRGMLARPYGYFLTANSGELGALVLTATRRVSDGIVAPFVTLVSKCVSAACILAVLLWTDPFVALVIVVMIAPIYGLTYYVVRGRLNDLGARITREDRESHKLALEAFSGVKDLKILGRTGHVARRFEKAVRAMAQAQSSGALLSSMPKFVIETVGVLLIVGVILASLARTRDPSTAVSLAALYAYAAYRLLPAVQSIFGSLSTMRYNAESLGVVASALGASERYLEAGADAAVRRSEGVLIRSRLDLKDVSFRYPEKRRVALESVSIAIPRGAHVAIVGPSGSGKSTLLDVLVGLLTADEGGVYVDGALVGHDDLPQLRSRIGYVPQSVFLADASIAENIAFGIPPGSIDEGRVRAAAQAAQIHEFIESSLPEKYATAVGERGIRLSGGQRQRLGIARAMYHDPELLILDEATNALDFTTEGAFMDTVRALAGTRTIISVAHRLASVRDCDRIFVLAKGRVVADGTYDELESSSHDFRTMLDAGRRKSR